MEYGLLVTNQSLIFVLEKDSQALLGYYAGGLIGLLVAEAAATRAIVDPNLVDPKVLAENPRNLVVLYSAIHGLRLHVGAIGAILSLGYASPSGPIDAQFFLRAPAEYVKRRKREGLRGGAARREYFDRVRAAIASALPAEVLGRAEWTSWRK